MAESLKRLLADTSPVTLGFSGLIIFGHLLTRVLNTDLASGLYLVPGHTLTKPWQVLAAGFFDDSIVSVLVSVLALLYCGSKLRSVWGEREFVIFVVLVNVVQACATWVAMIMLYILFRTEHFLFAQLGGTTGLLAGLCVAMKQQADSAAPSLPSEDGAVPLAASLSPLASLLWCATLVLVTHSGPPDEMLFAWNGLLTAWVYLRYYQPRQDGYTGDPAPSFHFANLFPLPLRRPLTVLSEVCFGVVSSCGCFPPAGWVERSAAAGSLAAAELQPAVPDLELATAAPPTAITTSDPAIAERRREKARALIDARLAARSAAAGEAGAAEEQATAV